MTIFFTKEQYLKKVPAISLRSTTSEHKLKEDDEIIVEEETTNISELVFFSDKANVYKLKTYDMPDSKVAAMGEYLPSLLGLEPGEKIIYTVVTKDFAGNMLFTFENGKMAKVELKNYETKNNRKKLIGAYSAKSPICDIKYLNEDTDIVLITENNRVLYMNTSLVPLKSTKSTQGVQVLRQPKGGIKPAKVELASVTTVPDAPKYVARTIASAAKTLKDGDGQMSLI